MATVIEVAGDYDPTFPPHVATDAALEHSIKNAMVELECRWLPTIELGSPSGRKRVEDAGGVLVAPGSPYRNMNGVLDCIRFAREADKPLLGTCGGFQHIILEYARNVLKYDDAEHAEYDPYGSRLIISKLLCSLVGRSLPIILAAGSRVAQIYGSDQAEEQYYCNFGVNPVYVSLLRGGPLQVVGWDAEGEVRVVELPDHRYFVGTLFVPQLRSAIDKPHPLIYAFIKAVSQHAG